MSGQRQRHATIVAATAVILIGLGTGCGFRSALDRQPGHDSGGVFGIGGSAGNAGNGGGAGSGGRPGSGGIPGNGAIPGSGGYSGGGGSAVICGADVCNHPPAPECAPRSKRRTYDLPAHCARGACMYTATDTTCLWGCVDAACQPPRFVYASAGGRHACAIDGKGAVRCWGDNRYGQLGNGDTRNSPLPVGAVDLDQGTVAVTAGEGHSCAILADASVRCWGRNHTFQLGENSGSDQHVPMDIDTTAIYAGVVALSAGFTHTCALMADGPPMCWGLWSEWPAPTGGRTESASSYPTQTPFAALSLAVAAGNLFTCTITPSHKVECIGANPHGQLGTGSTANATTPVEVSSLSDVRQLAAGFAHACAVTGSGGVKCWGANESGQLGIGSTADAYAPANVVGLTTGAVGVSAGTSSTCAVMQGGGVKCWGGNDFGQLGDGTTTPSKTPVDVTPLAPEVAVSVGDGFACAVGSQGHVACWGRNDHGQLGDGSTTSRSRPADVVGL